MISAKSHASRAVTNCSARHLRVTRSRPSIALSTTSSFVSPRGITLAAAAAGSAERAAPPGLAKYETLIILKPTLTDEERDQELARFESFLHQEECQDVKALVRGRQRMAYPVKGNWEGIYVLFSFIAKMSTTPKVQKLLSTPVAGKEDNILRHMTFKY